MVYCTKCGEKNVDDAKYCKKCGINQENLYEKNVDKGFEKSIDEWGKKFGDRMERWGEDFGSQVENECLGFPKGGVIFGLLLGIIIISVGLQMMFRWQINFGPFIVVIIGLLFVAGAVYNVIRKRSR